MSAQSVGDALPGRLHNPRRGPTVLRIALGAQLRDLRETSGISREDAARAIRASDAKISRLELGRVGLKRRDLDDLLVLYGVTDEQRRRAFLALSQQASTPGWWHQYGDLLPNWFELYIGLEQGASIVRTYELQYVPGLLQTEDYARAVTMLGQLDGSAEEIDRRVQLRMTRQKLLAQPGAPTVWAVVDEAALRRRLDIRSVMRAQVQHLIELTEQPNIILQVVPFSAGGHAAAGGPFVILRFAEPDLPDIVYLEQLSSALYLDKRRDVENYLAVMDRLAAQAEQPDRTTKLLKRIMRDI